MAQNVKFYLLNGDVPGAITYLNQLPVDDLETSRWKEPLIERFYNETYIDTIETDDDWIKSVILTYNEYFRYVLTKRMDAYEGEEWLFRQLSKYVKKGADINEVENELQYIFESKGWNFLGGVTSPFRGPYIWKTNEKHTYEVQLPTGIQEVPVVFMSHFIMQSWLHYATFGESYASGWAKKDALYCVKEAYEPLNQDKFQISFLKHEAQHLYDYHHFPNLEGYVLEYRAKLVELIYDNGRVFKQLLKEAKNDPNFPHSYASFLIVNHFKNLFNIRSGNEELKTLAIKHIQIAAEQLLRQSTFDLNNKKSIGFL